MAIEFEPEYLDEFRAYLRTKVTLSLASYSLDLLSNGSVPEDLKKRTIIRLKASKEELRCLQNNEQLRTYMCSLLSKILSDEMIRRMPDYINTTIDMLEGKEELNESSHRRLTNYFSSVFSSLTENYRSLEEKVLGRGWPSTTYTT